MSFSALSREELLYLSALVGVDNIWCIEDSFSNQTELEIRANLLSLQGSLLQKGCLEVTINDEIRVVPSYSCLINRCANSSRIFVLNSTQMEDDCGHLRYFMNDEMIVKYQLNGLASLSYTNMEIMRNEIISFFGDKESSVSPYSLVTGISRLRRMGSLSKQRFLQELRECGCEESFALLIVDGLQGKADFRTMLGYSRTNHTDALIGKIVTLNFSSGCLMVTNDDQKPDTVCFSNLSRERLIEKIDQILDFAQESEVV